MLAKPRSSVLATVLATFAVALVATTAHGGDSLLVLRSEPGDWLGQGQTLVFGPGQGALTTSKDNAKGFRSRFQGSGHNWSVDGRRGRMQFVVPGSYASPRRDFSGDTLHYLTVSGDGRSCNGPGYFDVRQIAYDAGGTARRLRVFFEYHCGNAPAGLTGELRINADTTVTIAAPLHVRARRGELLDVTFGSVHAAGLPLALTSGALPAGATFVDHGDGTGRLTWTPGPAQQGDYEVSIAASDGSGGMDAAHTLVQVDGDTLVDAVSEPGDRAWLQKNCRLRPGEMRSTTNTSSANFYPFNPSIGNRHFSINPNRPGNYSALRRWSDVFYAAGSFVASPAPGSCGGVETHYRVRRSTVGIGTLDALWVEWEQHCDGEAPAFRGEVRFNAGSPTVVRAPIARRVHFGDTLRFEVSGRDTLGRALDLSAWSLPSGCMFAITGPTSAQVEWCPTEAQSGPHEMKFRAVNVDGEADTVATDVVVTGDVSAVIVSEPGDLAGVGASAAYDGSPGAMLTTEFVSDFSIGNSDLIRLCEPGRSWEFKIRGAEGFAGHDPITAGRYSVPWPWPWNGVLFFGLNTSYQGNGYWTSDFRIRHIERSGGHARRLWLEFEQRSHDLMPILRGEIRFDVHWRVMARAPLRRSATESQSMTFEVTGETPDGEVPSIAAIALPPGGTLTPTAPGRAAFQWMPQESDVGQPRTAAFTATRQDGTADTTWTVLETLPSGSFHLEEGGRVWDLNSALGQFRVRGGAQWARATFSSPAADTAWSVEFMGGTSDSLQVGSYLIEEYGARACAWMPGDNSMCEGDTGRFEITRLDRAISGEPLSLWAEFLHASEWNGEGVSGLLHVGSANTLHAPSPPLSPGFECSQFLPNPARHSRRLELSLPSAGRVTMGAYDIGGRRVYEHDWGVLEAGRHLLRPPGLEALPPGLYLARIDFAGTRVTRRLAVIR